MHHDIHIRLKHNACKKTHVNSNGLNVLQEVNSIAFLNSKIFLRIFFKKILAWCNSIETSKIFLKIFLRWYLLKGHVQTVPYVVLENLFQKDFSKRFLKVQLNCTRLKMF